MNRIRSTAITLELGGKNRVWKWNYNALAELADAGVDITDERILTDRNRSPKLFRAIVWAGLVSADPALTLVDVGEWLSDVDLECLSDKIFAAITESSPPPDPNPTPEVQPENAV